MALDATVFCDCFERNELRCDPPKGVRVAVDRRGDVVCQPADERLWTSFQAWKQDKACLHRGMILVHHRLGKSEVIDAIRAELAPQSRLFPILVSSVLYSGTHTGDWLPYERLADLTAELKRLSEPPWSVAASDVLRFFQIQMAELVIAAQHTRKAISF